MGDALHFSAKSLKYFHARIQKIAIVTGEEGLRETEEFIWELHFSGILEPYAPREKNLIKDSEAVKFFNWNIQDSEELLQRNMEYEYRTLEKLEQELANGSNRQPGSIEFFKRNLEHFIHRGSYDNNMVSQRAADIVVAYIDRAKRVVELAEKAEPSAHDRVINSWISYRHDNSSTAHRAIGELKRAEYYFLKNEIMTHDRQNKIESGKIDAAIYMPRKRLKESIIAQQKGNNAKAVKLRDEADSYLTSSWEFAFPGQVPPSIDSLNISDDD